MLQVRRVTLDHAAHQIISMVIKKVLHLSGCKTFFITGGISSK